MANIFMLKPILPESYSLFQNDICPGLTHSSDCHGNGAELGSGSQLADSSDNGLNQGIQGMLHVVVVTSRSFCNGKIQ